METPTTNSETLSDPAAKSRLASLTNPTIYQCIACQMTTASLSSLHRHQTYRHTPEELSLSTIGLQCLMINNVRTSNSIVYDNSWLCDPRKQAEFYTVSATLLNDCNNNANDCVPIDYVVEKERSIFKEDNAEFPKEHTESESFTKQKARVFDSKIDCSFEPPTSLAIESSENLIQIEEFIAIPTEADRTPKSPEKVSQDEDTVTIGTEADCTPKSPEKVTEAQQSVTFGTEAGRTLKSPEKVTEAQESVTLGTEADRGFKSPEKVAEAKEFEAITHTDRISKYPEQEIKTEESKVIETEADHTPKSQEKIIKVEDSEVIDTEVDSSFVNCIEGLCRDLENIKNKPRKRKRASAKEPAPRKARAKAKPRAPRKKPKTSDSVLYNHIVTLKADQEIEISAKKGDAIIDCSKRNLESQVTENPVNQNFVNEAIVEGRLEFSESAAQNRDTEIPAKNDSPSADCVEHNLEKVEADITDQQEFANLIKNQLETCDIEIFANQDSTEANSVEIKSKIEEQEFFVEMDSSAPTLPTEFTFPWYPSDINDYSILVLDPQAHELVWTSVAIVDSQDEFQSEILQETPFLPELTEADLRNSEICENMTISSGSRAKESSGTSSLQSQPKGPAKEDTTKPRINFVPRPKRAAAKRLP